MDAAITEMVIQVGEGMHRRKYRFKIKTEFLGAHVSPQEAERLRVASRQIGISQAEMIRRWIASLPVDQLEAS